MALLSVEEIYVQFVGTFSTFPPANIGRVSTFCTDKRKIKSGKNKVSADVI
jgi:hypothetical protein